MCVCVCVCVCVSVCLSRSGGGGALRGRCGLLAAPLCVVDVAEKADDGETERLRAAQGLEVKGALVLSASQPSGGERGSTRREGV